MSGSLRQKLNSQPRTDTVCQALKTLFHAHHTLQRHTHTQLRVPERRYYLSPPQHIDIDIGTTTVNNNTIVHYSFPAEHSLCSSKGKPDGLNWPARRAWRAFSRRLMSIAHAGVTPNASLKRADAAATIRSMRPQQRVNPSTQI